MEQGDRCAVKEVARVQGAVAKVIEAEPCKLLVPDLVTALMAAPVPPNCALYVLVSILEFLDRLHSQRSADGLGAGPVHIETLNVFIVQQDGLAFGSGAAMKCSAPAPVQTGLSAAAGSRRGYGLHPRRQR